ncbi:hypothetical protein RA210_U30346 [Rubrivivax sp. A210]|uniref:hypothetical protein n=1 Tax=Rubrivivax sp. A210 TaxID=2772301 RepID=UPI00191A5ED2|nr:hypothetical protein [Rubrivivax sp. A210]CAD5373434.1 hypothetical protein RA210_U30346 [Rubrivivax sp. A210]
MFADTTPLTAAPDFERTGVLTTLSFEDCETPTPALDIERSTLSPSLLLDLKRYAAEPASADLLAVVAASVRHNTPLTLALELDGRPLELTLHPRRQLYYCELDLCAQPDQALAGLCVRRVEADAEVGSLFEARLHTGSLRPLLWHLALRGSNAALLPEIAGPVRCRVALGTPLFGLPVDGTTKRLIQRMKAAPVSLDELLADTLLRRAALQRIWNALYLQSALMVSRSYSQ